MSKYPISRKLFPFSCFVPPISEKFLKLANSHMNAPKKFLNAKDVSVTKHMASGCDGTAVDYYNITPDHLPQQAPCLFYIHGGGFVLKAAAYHYMNCLRYAKEAGCMVIFPDYRLAPACPFPGFFEDCYPHYLKWE